MSAATHVYAGDESRYAVSLARSSRPGTRTVRVLELLEGPGSLPVGIVVTVPAARVAPIGGTR